MEKTVSKRAFELVLWTMITAFFAGFAIGVYATFNHTPFDYFMFPILEHYGLV